MPDDHDCWWFSWWSSISPTEMYTYSLETRKLGSQDVKHISQPQRITRAKVSGVFWQKKYYRFVKQSKFFMIGIFATTEFSSFSFIMNWFTGLDKCRWKLTGEKNPHTFGLLSVFLKIWFWEWSFLSQMNLEFLLDWCPWGSFPVFFCSNEGMTNTVAKTSSKLWWCSRLLFLLGLKTRLKHIRVKL